jgi:hypothetical protein
VYEVNSKIFFLLDFLLGGGGGILGLDRYIFPWQTGFFGGCLKLEAFCVWENMVIVFILARFLNISEATCMKV